jgi:aldehyde:ferredoxin oxidoreductase
MSGGYMGKVLRVDLSTRKITVETLGEEIERRFLGGYGIGARYLFNEMAAGVDPLGPDNLLGFISGPLTGTPAISGTRYTVVGKSPLTGTWGDANSGGSFGAFLKFSGYDAVFFTGISNVPVYLLIDSGQAQIREAAHLWGRDTYDTDDILKKELGADTAIACIGVSGEKVARLASIVHSKGSVAARSGLGAVMGSKKLKAVAVRGRAVVPLADPEKAQELRKYCLANLGGHVADMRKFGTTFVTVGAAESGDSPVKNWSGIVTLDFPDAKPLDAGNLEARKLKNIGCYRCPVGCETTLKQGAGEYTYAAGTYRPEYETLAMFGSNCANNNLESIIKANDICNRYGIDTISVGTVVAFAMECFEKGIISRGDADGLELDWGNHRSLVALTEKIAAREGIGDVLADGVRLAAARIGKGAESCAMHVRGQEIPGHHPAASWHVTATYLTDATPGRHTQGSEAHHAAGLLPDFDAGSYRGRGRAHKVGACFQHALMCCGVCLFVNMAYPHKDMIAQFMQAVTGWDITTAELVQAGERIANIRQAFNQREKVDLTSYHLPERTYGKPPHREGPLAGVTVDKDIMVEEFLKEMDWDLVTGRPARKKLLALGLDDVAKILYAGEKK